jgi:CubicO group peptidase (beta-lactamase class C family)
VSAETGRSTPTRSRRGAGAAFLPSDAEIRRLLADRIQTLAGQDDGLGIVVGVVGPAGRRVLSYGHRVHGDTRPLDGDTGFEIGSVTKVFTALLLADMVQRGEVALGDPVAKHLPSLEVPERNGRPITLLDLATHTSGLPFMPELDDATATGYDAAAFRFLARVDLPRESGGEWDYSNVGYWLLAKALASRAGVDYETLLRTRIVAPLRLTGTAITPSPAMKANLAVGHNAFLQPSGPFSSIPTYAGMSAAGGLVSTANDLLTLLSAALGHQRSPLAPALSAMLATRRPMPRPTEAQALGWVVMGDGDDQLVVHDGGTWGYASSVAWDPGRRVGVVVLSNQVAGVDDIARHLLRRDVPLGRPTATRRTEIALDAAVLDSYAGRYEAEGEGAFLIAREADFLTIQPPADWGLWTMRLRPESLRDFFASELPLRVTFQADAEGRVNGLLVHPPRGQAAVPARRTSRSR